MERQKRLGNQRMTKLLVNLSFPATVGMLVNAFYNIIDTIFIGRGIGYLGIGGLTIVFPIQMVIMAVAQMVGIGAASVVSRNLGAKENEKANHVAGNAFLTVTVLGMILCFSGLVFINPLLRLFGATDILLPYAKEYMGIILIGSIYFPFAVCGNNLIRSEGNAKTAMTSMVIGAILNIILDYIFIFPFDMGIRGAALATIVSQLATAIYIIVYMFGDKTELRIKLRHFIPDWRIIYEVITVGIPSFARQIAGSLMAIVLNNSLGFYGGDLAISVYGVINRIMMFLFMPLFGLVHGMQPIVGYNYGAKKFDRVKEAVKLSIISTTVLATVSTLFGAIFPGFIIRLFDDDPQLLENGIFALRIVISMVPIIGVQIIGAAMFQSIGKAIPSLVLTLLRQVIFLIPMVLILPRLFSLGLLGIWISFPLADLSSTIFTVVLLKKEMEVIDVKAISPISTSF